MTWCPRIGKCLALFICCSSLMTLKNGECTQVEEQDLLNTSTAKVVGNLEVDDAEDGELSTDTGLYIMSLTAPVDGYINAVNACAFIKDSRSSPLSGDKITAYFYIAGYRLVGSKFKRVTDTLEFLDDVEVNQTFHCHMIVFAVHQRQNVLKGDRVGVFVSDSECSQFLTHPPSYICPAHPNIIDPITNCSQSLYFSDARLRDDSMPDELNAFSGQPVSVFINLDIIFEPEYPHNQDPPSRVCASKVTFQRTPDIITIVSVIALGMLILFLLVIVILACTIVSRNKRKVRRLKESIRRPDQPCDHQIDLQLSNVCYNEYDTSNQSTQSQSTKNHSQVDLLKSYHSYMISSLRPSNSIDRDEERYWQPAITEEDLKHQLHKLKVNEVPKNTIELKEYLGSGKFGVVYRGLLTVTEVHSEAAVKEVVVKTMESGASEEQRIKFLQEAAIMGQFNNPYIVKIYGVIITSSEPYMIVCELMSNGDLHRHLHTIKIMGTLNQTEAGAMLLSYSRQVASAMMYLSEKGYVHCDLATRNILLSIDGVCKISNFGLSRNLQDEDYYIVKNGVIPLRWTAPEAIQDGKFSTASDVWSYGVVLYEIWSLASKPYGSLTNEQVISQVLAGYRLPSPPGCPRAIYDKMIICWHPNVAQRPTFIDLQISLQQPDYELLKWSEEDKATYSENARTVGTVLQEGQSLFKDMQNTYYKCP